MSTFIVGDVLAEKYEIKAILGAGGMGTVYRARQLGLGRDVAIKVPNPQALDVPGFLSRFSREAMLVARLTHDNIVQVYEYHEGDDGVYIVMEYVEGHDLKRMITKPPSDLKVKDLANILRATCEGLSHAHEFGIVHRDIKPHNIMVQSIGRSKWRVKIMDFGIAHLGENTNLTMQQEQLTVTGQAIGTPTYMSPEQIRGTGVTAQSDIYSFGCVAFYCFTRQTPFMGTGFTVAASHLSDPAPAIRSRVPSLPSELDSVVSKCLEKDPNARPQDAADAGEELFNALQPIFDLKMSSIWPAGHEQPAGTDIVDPTASLQSSAQAPTVQGAPLTSETKRDQQPIVSPDFEPTAVDKKVAFEGERQAADQALAGGLTDAESPTRTSPAQVTNATIPYSGAAAPAVSTATERTPSKPMNKMVPMAAAVFVVLLIGGIVVGLMLRGKDGEQLAAAANGMGGDPVLNVGNGGGEPPGTPEGLGNPDVAPGIPAALETTPTPQELITKPTATPTASPAPKPTEDLMAQRIAAIRGDFSRAGTLPEKVRVWEGVRGNDLLEAAAREQLLEEFARDVTFSPPMSRILGGRSFTMGSRSGPGISEDEQPQHNVMLSPYKIGLYEVTALEFATFLNSINNADRYYRPGNNTNIQFEDGKWVPVEGRALHPANAVTWDAAHQYAVWLSAQTGEPYRLPTEAEWENAATGESGGMGKTYPWGSSTPDNLLAQFNGVDTVPVDEKARGQNSIGVYQMAGNVAEWCRDYYDETAYLNHQEKDPLVSSEPTSGFVRRVVRGGSFISQDGGDLRATKRARLGPDERANDVGFRLAMEASGS